VNRRNAIELTSAEQHALLEGSKTIVLSTIDRRGYPHSVAMWYVVDADGSILMTTYAKSQKALNIKRNPRVALLVESGTTYAQLKGVLIRGEAQLIDDLDTRLAILSRVHRKMAGAFPQGVQDALLRQASKRVVIKVVPTRVTSWDHAKLAGGY
jgi:PPOX class probable F420-dependent enzyme